ncbi:MAG TPA: hypothetical protein DDW52_16525 [Planctomycetaceae bacterium]|nr:hypothetical protein [Planctomycetaceae bacterium]
MPYEVFISYSRSEDVAHLGPEYKTFVEQYLRYLTFLDIDDIRASENWRDEIQAALQPDGAVKPYVLLIATPQAVEQPTNITDELRIAREFDLPIVAVEYAPKLARQLVGTNDIHFIEAHTEFSDYRLSRATKRKLEHALDSHVLQFLDERRRHAREWSNNQLPQTRFWDQSLDTYFPPPTDERNGSVALLASGGSGKTVLTATKISQLLSDPSYYPVVIAPDRHHDLRAGCRSILEQLHGASTSLAEKCEYWRNPPTDSHLAGRSRRIVFVVDGLDRFADPADPNQEGLRTTLNTLADAAPIYITCRKEVWDAWYQGKVSVETCEIENLPRDQVIGLLDAHTRFKSDETVASPIVSIPFFLDLAIRHSQNWPNFPNTEYKFLAQVWNTITQPSDDSSDHEGDGRSWLLEAIGEQQLNQLSYEVEVGPKWFSEKQGYLTEYATVLTRLLDEGVLTVRSSLGGRLMRQRHDLLDNHVMVRSVLASNERSAAIAELCERCGKDCGWSLLSSLVQALHELGEYDELAKLFDNFLAILDHKKFKNIDSAMTKSWAVTHVLKAKFELLFPFMLEALEGQRADSLDPEDDSHVALVRSTIRKPTYITQEAASTLGSAFAVPPEGIDSEKSIHVLKSCLNKFTYRGRFIEALARFSSAEAFEVLTQYANEQLALLKHSPPTKNSDPRSLLYLVQASGLLLWDFDKTSDLLNRIRFQPEIPAIVRRVATEALHRLDPRVELLPRTEEEILEELELYETPKEKKQYTDWRIVTDYARYIRSTFAERSYSSAIRDRLVEMLNHDQNFARREVALALSNFTGPKMRDALLNEILEEGIPSEVRQGCLQGLRDQLLRLPASEERQLYRLLLLRASLFAKARGQIVTSRGLLELSTDESALETDLWIADSQAVEVVDAPPRGFSEEEVNIDHSLKPGDLVARCIDEHLASGRDVENWEQKYRFTSIKCAGQRFVATLAETTWSLAQHFHEALRLTPEKWLHTMEGSKDWIEPLPLGACQLPGLAVVHAIAVTADQPPRTLLARRSQKSEYAPGHWSLSFEEQLTDRDFHAQATFKNCALRGLEEEFGIPAHECSFTLLTALQELNIMNLGVVGLVSIALTAKECEKIIREQSNWEIDDFEFIEVTKTSLSEISFADHQTLTPLHPTTSLRARILERFFYR